MVLIKLRKLEFDETYEAYFAKRKETIKEKWDNAQLQLEKTSAEKREQQASRRSEEDSKFDKEEQGATTATNRKLEAAQNDARHFADKLCAVLSESQQATWRTNERGSSCDNAATAQGEMDRQRACQIICHAPRLTP